MADNETIADIIAEMKRRKEMLEDAAFNAPLCYSTETVQAQHEILDEFIERFDAALERERGDCAKLREALVSVKKSIDEMGAASLDGDPEIMLMSLTQVCARLSARIDAALGATEKEGGNDGNE